MALPHDMPLWVHFFSQRWSRAQRPNTCKPCVKKMHANSGVRQPKWNATCAEFLSQKEVSVNIAAWVRNQEFLPVGLQQGHASHQLACLAFFQWQEGPDKNTPCFLSQQHTEEPTFLHCRVCQTLCSTVLPSSYFSISCTICTVCIQLVVPNLIYIHLHFSLHKLCLNEFK